MSSTLSQIEALNALIDALASGGTSAFSVRAGELHIGEVSTPMASPSASFNRPGDTTPYASGDLVANATAAASVVAVAVTAARVAAGAVMIRRLRLLKSGTSVTNASFRVHAYGTDPALSSGIANGDNGAWSTKQASYLGSFDCDMSGSNGRVFTDGAQVIGLPSVGTEITHKLASGQTIYFLIEARAAYTPANGETFTVIPEIVAQS